MKINNSLHTPDVDTDNLTDLLNKLGIKELNGDEFNLILWNDHVNSMDHVAKALYEICNLTPDECVRVMLEAHENNRAIAKFGTEAEMLEMKRKLTERHIESTIEQ